MSILRLARTVRGPATSSSTGKWPDGNLIAALAYVSSAWRSPSLQKLRDLVNREASTPTRQAALARILGSQGPVAQEALAVWLGLGLPVPPELAARNPAAALIAGVATGRIPVTNPTGATTQGWFRSSRTTGQRPDPNTWRPSPALRAAQVGADSVVPGAGQIVAAIAHALDNQLPFDEAFKNTLRSIPGFGTAFGLVDDFVTWLGRELGIGESPDEQRERLWREWLAQAPQRMQQYAQQTAQALQLRQQAEQTRARLARDPSFAESYEGYKARQDIVRLESDARVIETQAAAGRQMEAREADYAQQLDQERADPTKRAERHAREMTQQQARHEGAIERGFDLAAREAKTHAAESERYGAEATTLERYAEMARNRAHGLEGNNQAILDTLNRTGQLGPIHGGDPSTGIRDNDLRRDFQANRREAEAYRREAAAWEEKARWLREQQRKAKERENTAQQQARENQRRAQEQNARAGIIARVATGQGTPQDYQQLAGDPSLQRQFQDAVNAIAQTAAAPTTPRPAQQARVSPVPYVPDQGLQEVRFQQTSAIPAVRFQLQDFQTPSHTAMPPVIDWAQQQRAARQRAQISQQQQAQQLQVAFPQQQLVPQIPVQPPPVFTGPDCSGVDPAARVPGREGWWCTQWDASSGTCLQMTTDCRNPAVRAQPPIPNYVVTPHAPSVAPSAPYYGGGGKPAAPTPGRGRGPSAPATAPAYFGDRLH